jgi:hypothetical protein
MFKIVGKSEPNILCITDYLIGDMSDINYEFLLLNRPILLLSNVWLDKNFPSLGLRISNVYGLSEALDKIIQKDEFSGQRKKYINQAFAVTDVSNADVTLQTMLSSSQIDNPILAIHHKNNIIYKSNLLPLINSARKLNIEVVENQRLDAPNVLNIGAHFGCLLDPVIAKNYCIHLDHGLKGEGTANVEISKRDYLKNNFFPSVNLHVTAGQMGQIRTEKLLGPMKGRAKIGAYPKATSIIEGASPRNRKDAFKAFGLNPDLPVITYAPAGEESYEKPGGSLSKSIISELKNFEKFNNVNVVIKFKYPFFLQRKLLSSVRKKFNNVFLR